MRKVYVLFILLSAFSTVYAQKKDSINLSIDTTLQINEVVITATRTERNSKDIPAHVEVIQVSEIENYPVNNIDDILRAASNVYVNRSWGIFSKNSAVTMRGLMGSDRTLILIDGVAKNKLAGGSVNWHNINPDIIDRIEIINGPASALYGNNAMGGVINIITKRPKEKITGSVKGFCGTFNTVGSSVNVMGNEIKNNKGFYWNINGFYRQGDGYIFEPAEALDSTDTETFLQEFGGGTKLGYQLNKNHTIEFVYDYYDEKRGGGTEVFVEDGKFDDILTQQFRSRYLGDIGGSKLQLLLSYSTEDYIKQSESVNQNGEYKLSDANTFKSDKGVWLAWSNELVNYHYITFGGEVKLGNVDGNEIYRTTSDEIYYEGTLEVYALFLQDEIRLLQDKLKVITGLRGDFIQFKDGWQNVLNPTKSTGFASTFEESFENNSWQALSPKLAVQYSFSPKTTAYVAASSGYKPPKLDDLSKSGKIRKGFRLANPNLKPEELYSCEIGLKKKIGEKLSLNPTIYYQRGKDFHYLLGTGDSVDTGGSSLKPVYCRENISDIEITGFEISFKYKYNNNIYFDANYAYNNSVILDYKISANNPSVDLTDMKMVEVSPHIFYAGITWDNKYLTTGLNCVYTDEQYVDDANTQLLEDYFLVNLKLSKTILEHYKLWFDVQNIFDIEFIDRKNRLSTGRFIVGGFQYRF